MPRSSAIASLFPAPGATLARLTRIPYDVQEDITTYLTRSDLHSLSLASKYFASLAARALYARICLHSGHAYPPKSPWTSTDPRPKDTLRRRQFSFIFALSQHPEYTHFVRHIAFEFIDNKAPFTTHDHLIPEDLVWNAFSKCTAVISIDIKMSRPHDTNPPRSALFPNLKEAKIDGTFPAHALDRMLHTSSQLRSLHIVAGTAEYVAVHDEWRSWSTSLSPFITRSVESKAFQNLQILHVEAHQSPRLSITATTLGRLLEEGTTPSLEELTLSLEDDEDAWQAWDMDRLFGTRKRMTIHKFRLQGVEVTCRQAEGLKDKCPKLEMVELTDTDFVTIMVL